MKIRLLRKVQAAILKEPLQFGMERWFSDAIDAGHPIPNCGTAACIGGWAVTINRGANPIGVRHLGGKLCKLYSQEALGLTSAQTERLLYLEGWPRLFRRQYNHGDFTQRAIVACRRIDFFIKTKGTDNILRRKGRVKS
jgi:hypothetical protein